MPHASIVEKVMDVIAIHDTRVAEELINNVISAALELGELESQPIIMAAVHYEQAYEKLRVHKQILLDYIHMLEI